MTIPAGYTDLTTSAALVHDAAACLYRLKGRDVREWLQGQVTNDVRRLDDGPWLDACFVTSTGQLEATARVWGDADGLVLEVSGAGVLERRVADYVILEDVALEPVVQGVWTIVGPGAGDTDPGCPPWPSPRFGLPGLACATRPNVGLAEASTEAVRVLALESGTPLIGVDTDARTLPPELGPAFDEAHVAYDKGCYVGQEVLQRIHSRGHTNKTWVVLALEGPPGGLDVTIGGLSAGRATHVEASPKVGVLAGAVLRNEHAVVGTLVSVGGVPGRVRSA